MFARLKINTALFICFAFVFRLLFVNVNLVASPLESSSLVAKHFSVIQKKHYSTEATVQSGIINYATLDVCEEDSDNEEDFKKACSTVVLPTLFSFHTHIPLTIESNRAFDFKCDSYPKKYLAISSLRI